MEEELQSNKDEQPLGLGFDPDLTLVTQTSAKPEREISPEHVEQLERSRIDTENKTNLLLVETGVKPCALMILAIRNGENTFLSDIDLSDLESLIKQSGVAFNIGERQTEAITDDRSVETMEILISQSKEQLEQLKKITKKLQNPEQTTEQEKNDAQRELGSLFGYPDSASKAFRGEDGKELLDTDSLPEEVKQSDAYVFSQFKLSKDNWQEELKQGQIWADTVKKFSPKIYKDTMEGR